jgi:GH15 family glucan-1,4-alpha-glucosidase
MEPQRYPPVADYALIGDCHGAALVSKGGSIDWCCMPRFDSPSLFGRLLDWDKGGHCSISPKGSAEISREYCDKSLVLQTTFRTETGEARAYDFFAMREGGRERPYRQLVRIVEGLSGRVQLQFSAQPRFDYGQVAPWIRREGTDLFSAVGGSQGLVFFCDFDVDIDGRHDLEGSIDVRAGERARLAIRYLEPHLLDDGDFDQPDPGELDRRLQGTLKWWRSWVGRCRFEGPDADPVFRSAMVLKALTYAPTGAIAAAPTTSLPAVPGEDRNWDYRFSWVRDSEFTVRSLFEVGAESEPEAVRKFIERSAAGAGKTPIVFGMEGERRLDELELDGVEGYRGSGPVRIGNEAWRQDQHDVFGEILELAWQWYRRGHSPDDEYWEFICDLVDGACESWREPDRGMWEIRGEPQHLVHSKVMCWGAIDRGIKLSAECARAAPVDRWEAARKEIKDAVESEGYDRKRGIFVRAFGKSDVDAALLLIPVVEFCAYEDERMVRTADVIAEELEESGLIHRNTSDGPDLNAFLPCTFWLAECYARQGRSEDARAWFDRAAATANDLGLFSEQYDPREKEMRGNFPQGLTHLSHIAAAFAIAGGRFLDPQHG